jgi:hypothetical protein
LIVLVAAGVFSGQLLRKEKDEASPATCFRRDSLNAFIPRFAGVWRFFIFKTFQPRAGLSTKTVPCIFIRGTKNERSAK